MIRAPFDAAWLPYNGTAYFLWSTPPPDTVVRMTVGKPNTPIHLGDFDHHNNGVILDLDALPVSGELVWAVQLIYRATVFCRIEGKLYKALSPEELALTPSATATMTWSPTATAPPTATTTAPATPPGEVAPTLIWTNVPTASSTTDAPSVE
jgi:hypothetical protein